MKRPLICYLDNNSILASFFARVRGFRKYDVFATTSIAAAYDCVKANRDRMVCLISEWCHINGYPTTMAIELAWEYDIPVVVYTAGIPAYSISTLAKYRTPYLMKSGRTSDLITFVKEYIKECSQSS